MEKYIATIFDSEFEELYSLIINADSHEEANSKLKKYIENNDACGEEDIFTDIANINHLPICRF